VIAVFPPQIAQLIFLLLGYRGPSDVALRCAIQILKVVYIMCFSLMAAFHSVLNSFQLLSCSSTTFVLFFSRDMQKATLVWFPIVK